MKHSIVIDTTTQLGAILPDSTPKQALRLALRKYTLTQCAQIVCEIENFTNRRKIVRTCGAYGFRQLVRDISRVAKLIVRPLKLEPLPAAATKTTFLEHVAAVGARSNISGIKHLLSIRLFSLQGRPDLQIWTPRQFLVHEQARKLPQLKRMRKFSLSL